MTFTDLLTQSITIEPYEGQKGSGGPAYGAPVVYGCRIDDQQVLMRNAAGVTVYANTVVFLPPDAVVNEQSRATVNGVARTIVNCSAVYGRSALHHLEIKLE